MKRRQLIEQTLYLYSRGRISELPSSAKLYKFKSKPCRQCKTHFTFVTNNTLYCHSCKRKRITISNRRSQRKLRYLSVRKVEK